MSSWVGAPAILFVAALIAAFHAATAPQTVQVDVFTNGTFPQISLSDRRVVRQLSGTEREARKDVKLHSASSSAWERLTMNGVATGPDTITDVSVLRVSTHQPRIRAEAP